MMIFNTKCFDEPIAYLQCFKFEELKNAFDEVEKYKNQGFHLVGYVRYNFEEDRNLPILYFEVFDKFKKYKETKTNTKIHVLPLIEKEEYFNAVQNIKNEIKCGNVYEVNYTYPSLCFTKSSDIELYNYLVQNQKTPYRAFIENEYETIMSFSPELFFKIKGNKIITKPMKGTIIRGKNFKEDNKNKKFLYNDIKNRAENIMIVDLLRNDLGKIAKTGSVKVEELFKIEKYKTVFQMISTISAKLDEKCSLYEVFRAIFPSGSITGAPKKSAIEIIKREEPSKRGVYCGAIGYINKKETVFSVAIRILQRKKEEAEFICHTGGAIVWDSSVENEWEESYIKRNFLNPAEFQLIETAKDNWDMHCERMKASAKKLNFKWNKKLEVLQLKEGVITRVLLNKNGEFEIQTRDLKKIQSNKIVFKGKVNSKNPFLYHKTTARYEKTLDVFDEIRTNEKGEVTEGTYTNIGILKNGEYFTPPVSCGLLNGIFRQKLIKESFWREKILYPKDIYEADKIYCFNSIRGLVEVKLC